MVGEATESKTVGDTTSDFITVVGSVTEIIGDILAGLTTLTGGTVTAEPFVIVLDASFGLCEIGSLPWHRILYSTFASL